MGVDLNDLVWVTMNLDDGNRIAYAGPYRLVACRVAAALVGNSSGTNTGEIVLYGPGDGTTSVMVRQIPRGWVGPANATDAVAACRAVLEDLYTDANGFWRAGPWADPSTP